MTARSELQGRRGEWLIELIVNGSPFRFGTIPAVVELADGRSLEFREGLDDIEQSVISDGSTDYSVPITLNASEAWEDLVGNFLSFERAPATLWRWFDGQLLDDARIMISGQVDGLAYSERLEPITFSILRQLRTQSRQIPTPGMVVDGTTWPVRGGYSTDARLLGAHYPVVIGAPGTPPGGNANPATEGLMVEFSGAAADDRLLIAGHRVEATTVRVFDFTDAGAPVATNIAVSQAVDGAGRTVSFVNMATFGGTTDQGRVYYVGWSTANGGGLLSPTTRELLRGGGDVVEWALRTFTDVKVDASRFRAIRSRLNAYKFDTYINAPIDPLEWLNSEILSVLPVEPRQGEEGLYYYVRRWGAQRWEAVARLDADLGQIDKASNIETVSEQVVNEVSVAYGPNRASGRHRFRVIVGPTNRRRSLLFGDEFEPGLVEDDDRFVGSYRAALSQEKYGRQPLAVELNSVWDTATATRHAQDIIAEQALPRRFVSYTAQTDLEALDVGAVVILNDSRVRLFDVLALIVDIQIGAPEVLLTFEILDDPAQIERASTT